MTAVFVQAVALSCLLLSGSSAWGGYKQFVPKYVDFSADFQVRGLYENNKTTSESTSNERSNLNFLEALAVKGLGYIYSPLFISMASSLSLGLEQDRDEKNDRTYSSTGYATQFKQEFKILPAHPYNLEIYALRATPLTTGQSGSNSGSVVIYEQGAMARYNMRPWSSSLMLINHEQEANTETQTRSLRYNLNYFTDFTSVSGSYSYSDNTVDSSSENTRNLYTLNFSKQFNNWVHFSSNWSRDEDEFENSFLTEGKFTSSNEYERLRSGFDIELPYNFDTSLYYTITEKNTSFTKVDTTTTFSDTDRAEFSLRHRLYRSLNSTFSTSHQTSESDSGDTTQDNFRLNFNYSKRIPWGIALTSLFGTLNFLDNLGAPVSLFETHNLETGGPGLGHIDLTFQTIEESTIVVHLVDSINNNRLIPLVEGIDYNVIPFNNSFRIFIISFPPINDPALPGLPTDYSYQVDYAFIPADYELENKSIGTSVQFQLFNNLLTPHYSFLKTDQRVLDGIFPGEPASSTSHAIGLGFSKSPFKGDATQSWLRSNTISEDRLTSYVSYNKNITPFTTGGITLSFEDVESTQQTQGNTGPTITLSEQSYAGQVQVQTIFPQKNLNLSFTGNYSLYKGTGETTNFSFFSTLIWRVGRLSVDLSASYTDTESTVGGNTSTNQFTLVKFMLKRELF